MITAGALVLAATKDVGLAFKHLRAAFASWLIDKSFRREMGERAAKRGNVFLTMGTRVSWKALKTLG